MNSPTADPESKRSVSNILIVVMLCLTVVSTSGLALVLQKTMTAVPVYQLPGFDCASFVKSVAAKSGLTVPGFGGHGHAFQNRRGGIQPGHSHHIWTGILVGSKVDLADSETAIKRAFEDEFRRRRSTVINEGRGGGDFTLEVRTGNTETHFEVFLSEIIEQPKTTTISPHHRRQIFVSIHEY